MLFRSVELALKLSGLFVHRFYLEVQRAGRADDEVHVSSTAGIAHRLKLPLVATHPVQFTTADDFEAHEARVCISEGEILANPRRTKRFTREQYFKPFAAMCELFADLPSAIANTVEIAMRCNLNLVLGKPQLPDFPIPPVGGEVMAPEAYFRHVSRQGLEARLEQLYPTQEERAAQAPRYQERLEFETDTIVKMGFAGYFLIEIGRAHV